MTTAVIVLEFVSREVRFYHGRMNSLVGAAAVGRDVSKVLRITDKASIFTAELVALNLALDIIRRSTRKKFVIFQTLFLV